MNRYEYFSQTYRKLCFTLMALLVTFCMFSNSNKGLFIQEGSQIAGLEHLYSAPSLGIIYVKEGANFNFDNTTTAEIVYFSTTPSLQKGESLLSIIWDKAGSAAKQPTQIISTIAPCGKFPFQEGAFSNAKHCIAMPTMSIFKNNKPTSFIVKYAYPTKGDLPYADFYTKGIVDAYHYYTPHHKIALLSSYYSLPPPLV